MESQILIFGQIIIDIIMVAVVLWFVRFHYKQQISLHNHEAVIEKSEAILADMMKISKKLEENLEEKKELSQDLLSQLDQGLKKAEESYGRIKKIMPGIDKSLNDNGEGLVDQGKSIESVKALLKKGVSKKEISKYLNLSLGEIDLMMKLESRKDRKV